MAHATQRFFGNARPRSSRGHRPDGEAKGSGLSTAEPVIGPKHLLDAVSRHAAICVTDSKGTLIQIDEGMCRLAGYSPGELLGKNYRELFEREAGE